jgi:glucose/arabinose dehydrogenase
MKRLPVVIIFILMLLPVNAIPQLVGDKPQHVKDAFQLDGDNIKVEVWIQNLRIPWSLIFLPDNRALVSERTGVILLIKNRTVQQKPYAKIDVVHSGEGGLMGLAIHPQFPKKPFVYAMHTYKKDGKTYNRVIRLRDNGDSADFDKVIIDNIPGSRLHNGGRIAFGPDGMLYITTGENFKAAMAQDLRMLGGKILRVTPEGEIPADNPFKNSPVYSYGNRNPQGIAWQPGSGRLFESEHGPSGEFGLFANDEINIIVRGGNYGWPKAIGAPGRQPYIDPIIVWKDTTPPSGMTFYKGNLLRHLDGDLFIATLRSEALIRIRLDGANIKGIERWFAKDNDHGKYGRLRDVVEGPEGALYFLSNNTDGRGRPLAGDDKIYRIVPKSEGK